MGMQLSFLQQTESCWHIQLHPETSCSRISLDPSALAMWKSLLREAREANIRILTLSGTEQAFCHGMDLASVLRGSIVASSEFASSLESDVGIEREDVGIAKSYAEILFALLSAPFAVLSLVEGDVFAGGLGFLAASDWVIASEQARFGLPEASLGLTPAMVLVALEFRMSAQNMRWLSLTSSSISAEQAISVGLIDQIVPQGSSLHKAARPWMRSLLRAHPQSILQIKRQTLHRSPQDLWQAFAQAAVQTQVAINDPDVRAAIRATEQGEGVSWHQRLTKFVAQPTPHQPKERNNP
ncbi:MAG: enoyl-CoA hydratase/isomerase family protein [Myxococcota bacterium]